VRRALLGVLLGASLVLAGEPGSDWNALLGRVASRKGVEYAKLKKERKTLDRYIASLATADSGETRAEKIAFWINAYNALTLQHVLDHKPDEGDFSVRDSVKGFWTDRSWKVAGKKVTLDGIEHGILRKEFAEPRVHFALNCASRSCPPLMPALYRAKTLDVVLSQQTRAYLADEEQNHFDYAGERAEVSTLFRWYREDFGPLQQFLAEYAPSERLARSLRKGHWAITFKSYDWSLNDAAKRPEPKGGGVGPGWLVLYVAAALGLLFWGFRVLRTFRGRWRIAERATA
jgi:hypothetical protein